MSPENPLPSPPAEWPVLGLAERRVLGVLVEKQKTTPDAYPMSVNALIVGCNQKSNRDPVMNLTAPDVEDTLVSLQKRGLVMQVVSGRVEKTRHLLYETWAVSKTELAVLAELLLRGPQTEGELRGRVARMDPVADLDQLRPVLRSLAERRLVVYLVPEGRRGTAVTHGFHDPTELERVKQRSATVHDSAEADQPATRSALSSTASQRVDELTAQLAELKQQVDDLRTAVDRLDERINATSPTATDAPRPAPS